MNIDSLSLDQIRAAIAVIEEGSFSGAARRFNRGQSAVSYSVAALEQQLGIELFDRSGYRPVLTVGGAALAGEMTEIVSRADRLRTRAVAMSKGLEAELSIVCDVMFPLEEMARILKQFEIEFPTVPVRLYVEVLGGSYELVVNGTCAIGIVSQFQSLPSSLEGHAMPGVPITAVAAPSHALAGIDGPISLARLRDELQVVLTDRSAYTKDSEFRVFARRTWRVSDLSAKHTLIRQGLGWGTLPDHMVREEVHNGTLKALKLEPLPASQDEVPISAVQRIDMAQGPAGRWMLECLKTAQNAAPETARSSDAIATHSVSK